jgi:hypothetical protein
MDRSSVDSVRRSKKERSKLTGRRSGENEMIKRPKRTKNGNIKMVSWRVNPSDWTTDVPRES